MDKNHILVAVYGTLKRNYNGPRFFGNSSFIGGGITIDKYLMASKGFPVIKRVDDGHNVVVEVFKIDEATLASLDRYEGYPFLYKRERRAVKIGGEVLRPFIYEGNDALSMIRPENMVKPNEAGLLEWSRREFF